MKIYKDGQPVGTIEEQLKELREIKDRAEGDYKDALFVYANCPVGTISIGRKEAYHRIWILAGILGYTDDKVEKDMHEAERKWGYQ